MIQLNAADEQLLLNALKDGNIVLALGAGASATSLNSQGEKVRQGKALAELLTTKVGLPYAGEELPEVLPGIVGPRISQKQFEDILRLEYTKIQPSDEIQNLLKYTWRRIYTWNIDDSINNVKSSSQIRKYFNGLADKVSVHDGHDYLQIINLHGDASKPEHGFIFSPADYNRRINKNEHDWYRELSSDYISYTPIFIGSRLNEPILSAELDRARPSPEAGLGMAFLVTPDNFTEIQLASFNAKNIVIIQATLKDFVEWISEKLGSHLTPPEVAKRSNAFVERLLAVSKAISRAEIEAAEYVVPRSWTLAKKDADDQPQPTLRRMARRYLEGAPPSWLLAATTVPVWLQRSESLYKSMTDAFRDRERCFIAHGQSGSGKTTAILQSLLKYSRENEKSYIYELKGNVPSLRSSLSLISRLHEDEHVVLYIPDAFIFGDGFAEDIMSISPGRITVVTSARSGEWRDHIQRRIGSISKDFLYQRFGEQDHQPLIQRLIEYVPAPAFIKLTAEEKINKLKTSQSQLLIALKETTSSENFTKVITNEFLTLPDDDCRTLAIIAGVATLARSGIQESHAREAYTRLAKKRDFKSACGALEGIVTTDSNGRLWARHELYVRHLIENVADFSNIVDIIIEILRNFTKYRIPIVKTVGRLDAVLFKFLLNHNLNADLAKRRHGKLEGRRIYETFEVEFQLDGHFWLQYGQYLVTIGEKEEALSVLGKSIDAYSNNPYAVHAFADLQLRVAAKRPHYDSETAKLIGDAVKTLTEQHGYLSWDSDQYPIVTLAEKHINALIRHKKDPEARQAANLYFEDIQRMSQHNSARPLQIAKERLAHYVTTGRWYSSALPNLAGSSTRLAPRKHQNRGRRPRGSGNR